jgi:N-acetylglucosamine-6-sulfatase
MLSFLLQLLCLAVGISGKLHDAQEPLSTAAPDERPNIVFILSDDQDMQMNSLSYMPHLQKHLVAQGTTFQRHYCTIALCCPSRVSLWTGRAAHNTNVTDVNPPYGDLARASNDNY